MGLRLLLFVGWCLAPIYATATSLGAQASSGNSMQPFPWTREPRMGEASKPGPHAYFDNESDDAWSEFGDLSQPEPEQPDGWLLPPTECEAAMGTEGDTHGGSSTETTPTGMGLTQVQAGKNAVLSAVHNGLICMPTSLSRR